MLTLICLWKDMALIWDHCLSDQIWYLAFKLSHIRTIPSLPTKILRKIKRNITCKAVSTPPPPHIVCNLTHSVHHEPFSSLTPSHLLKVNKFLVKISQFKFFVGKTLLFISIFCFRFVYFLCKNWNPLKKVTPPHLPTPSSPLILLSKNWDPVKFLFLKIW